jgi:phosphoglycerate dehydrogenase-like enzyme
MVNAPLRIAVTDPIMAAFADDLRLTRRAHDWRFADAADPASVRDSIAGADVIVCSRLTRADLAGGTGVRLVHATGAGVDRVDLDAVPPQAAV